MGTTPKKLAFKLYFRKKTKVQKIIHREIKLRQLSRNNSGVNLTQLPYVLTDRLSNYDTDQKQNIKNWSANCNYRYFKKQQSFSLMTKKLLFGRYGICFVQYATINAIYVETIKLDIARILKKKGRVWSRICCDTPVSARPAETRMGKGKGSISYWIAKVEPGQLFFEFSGITKAQLEEIFQKLCKKTSVGLKIIS